MKFRTTILQGSKTATGIRVPDAIVEALGHGKRPLVLVTINGYTYRSAIAVMGGTFMVGVSAENRAGARVAGGDAVDVDIVVDTEPRVIPVPPELQKALNAEPVARQAFDVLSNSKKQQLTLPIENAKTDETRQRNIDKAILVLKHGKSQRSRI